MAPLSTTPRRAEAIPFPVRALAVDPMDAELPDGNAVSLLLKPMLPWGSGTWKKGNFTERNSAPNLKACVPLLMATFWTKSQTLLYSLVGIQSAAPIPLYPDSEIVGRPPLFNVELVGS